MHEEIERILRMLEEGKISAEEAERLIRALRESEAPRAESRERAEAEPNLCETLAAKLREIAHALRAAQSRQRRAAHRYAVWCRYSIRRHHEQERRRRADNWTVYRRVKHVLLVVAIVGDHVKPESRLRDLLDDQLAWDNLRFGLEEEFRVEVSAAELYGLETVQAVADYIGSRLQPASSPAAEPSAQPGPEASAEPPATGPGPAGPQRAGRRRPGGSAPEPA